MAKTKDGYYRASFTGEDGKRHEVYSKKKSDLADKVQEAKAKIKKNSKYIDTEKLTLDMWFAEWIESKGARKQVIENTIRQYDSVYKTNISPILGNQKVQKLDRRKVEAFQEATIRKMNNGEISATTCRFIFTLLKNILNSAVRKGIIEINPTNALEPVKNKGKKATETTHRALTREEQTAFFEAAKSNFYYEFMALMVLTGMRQGEVSALTMADIDYNKNVIHISKTATRDIDGKVIMGTNPKTKAGKRDIPLTEPIKAILNSQLKKRRMILNAAAVVSIESPIFVSSRGGFILNAYITKAIKSVLSQLEADGKHIEPFTSHAFRDTFATRFVEQTKDLQTLKTILGHESLQMTADLYAHVLDDTKQEAMNSLQIII
jgi:integrase